MLFSDLVNKFEFKEVWERLVSLYPDQKKSKKGYANVFSELKSLSPVETEFIISITHVVDDLIPEDTSEYDNVSGLSNKDDISYAIEFTRWEQWLAMPLGENTLKNYSEIDILAHCLWEMTWSGYEQEEIQEKLDSITEAAEDIRKSLDKT